MKKSRKRPSGLLVLGWSSLLFCALLAFLNAVIATEPGLRALFLVCGGVMVVTDIVMVCRWCRAPRSIGPRSDPEP